MRGLEGKGDYSEGEREGKHKVRHKKNKKNLYIKKKDTG